jgi:hypothetical protein
MERILQRAHRYGYDHAMFLCGACVTEVVTSGGKTQLFPPVVKAREGRRLNVSPAEGETRPLCGSRGAPQVPRLRSG